jgi:methylase of polypeptide subunit release factors
MRFLGTGVGRFSLTFAKTPAPQIFARSLRRYVKTAATFEWLRDTVRLRLAEAPVIEADARHLPDGLGKFDILLTSPPYLPASSGRESYAKARAPSLIALGMKDHYDIDQLVDGSVGSMGGYRVELAELTDDERHLVEWLRCDSLRAIKAEPTARYFLEMRQAFVEMARVLQPGGLAVVVSGKQSTFYNFSTREALYVVRSAEMLADEAERAGLLVDALHDVQLLKSNMNARPRSLDDYFETLIILRKPG